MSVAQKSRSHCQFPETGAWKNILTNGHFSAQPFRTSCRHRVIVILAPALKIFNKIVLTPWRYALDDTKQFFANKLVFLTLTNFSSKPLSLRDCLFREHRVSTLLCGLPPDVCLGLVCKGLPQSNSHLPSLCYCSFLKNLQQNWLDYIKICTQSIEKFFNTNKQVFLILTYNSAIF
jgi:hypothetical protein